MSKTNSAHKQSWCRAEPCPLTVIKQTNKRHFYGQSCSQDRLYFCKKKGRGFLFNFKGVSGSKPEQKITETYFGHSGGTNEAQFPII